MAKVSFNEFNVSADANNTGTSGGDYAVKFFSLKNGEDAIVRILVDSADDFDIRTIHRVTMDGYQYGRNVNCIMEGNNPSTCPLCASGNKINQKLFIRMLKYSVENNAVVVTPVVWERNVYDRNFGTQALINCIRDYGPLSDIICRISRVGEGLNTVYNATYGLNIMPNTKSVYRDELYPKNVTLFGDFDVLGVSIMDKNYEELTQFLQTGTFPLRNNNATSGPVASIPQVSTPNVANAPVMPNTAAPSYGAPGTYEAAAVPVMPTTPTINTTSAPVSSTPAIDNPTINVAAPRPTPQWGGTPPAGNEGGFNRPRRF